ncbi:hypothetical protein [Sciscionella sediminilitoris]|uniref:hypothetical protein n=1 Tax=Sciscionella sediminilitoris TaxID=1445613 RepID=UPI0012E325A9|nr:hypothetical protein [Sciscionella sp. SE31]
MSTGVDEDSLIEAICVCDRERARLDAVTVDRVYALWCRQKQRFEDLFTVGSVIEELRLPKRSGSDHDQSSLVQPGQPRAYIGNSRRTGLGEHSESVPPSGEPDRNFPRVDDIEHQPNVLWKLQAPAGDPAVHAVAEFLGYGEQSRLALGHDGVQYGVERGAIGDRFIGAVLGRPRVHRRGLLTVRLTQLV